MYRDNTLLTLDYNIYYINKGVIYIEYIINIKSKGFSYYNVIDININNYNVLGIDNNISIFIDNNNYLDIDYNNIIKYINEHIDIIIFSLGIDFDTSMC